MTRTVEVVPYDPAWPVEFAALEGSQSGEAAFMRDRYFYGVRGRYNVGYGLWQTAYGAIL